VRLAILVAALVLAAAAPAGASIWPEPSPQSIHTFTVTRTHLRMDTRSCMAKSTRAKIARWLAPVACEQPPRSEQLLLVPLFGG
jgi:hypothetical protein